MINKVINIDVDYEKMGVEKSPRQTTLTTYIIDKKNIEISITKKRPAVIVCPGGGYSYTSEREAEPIALKYCAAGFHSFVLDYSVEPSGFPAAVCELSKAVKYVKEIADEYDIDKDKIFVIGFSAGAHLAASLAVHFDHLNVKKFADVDGEINKPAGVLLAYPVITAEEGICHEGSIVRFCAGRPELRETASLEKHVTKKTPPCFIWHTYSDTAVPVESSLLFASALRKNSVPFELHIFPEGPHGMSLADRTTSTHPDVVDTKVQKWFDLSVEWIWDLNAGE